MKINEQEFRENQNSWNRYKHYLSASLGIIIYADKIGPTACCEGLDSCICAELNDW